MSILQICSPGKAAGRWLLILGLAVAAGMVQLSVTLAFENAVVVESKTVVAGSDSVRVAIWISNDTPLWRVNLPLEIRAVSGEAFTRDHITVGVTPGGRLYNSGLNDMSACWPWPWVNPQLSKYHLPDSAFACSGPISESYHPGQAEPTSQRFVSPDALFWRGENGSCTDGDLSPGVDLDLADSSSLYLQFGVSPSPGQFVIDTCCVGSAHLMYYGSQSAVAPSFTPGYITVQCRCPCVGDPQCDSVTDVLDVLRVIERSVRGESVQIDQSCSGHGSEVDGRTDIDCSGSTDIVDVVVAIEVVFRGGDWESLTCNPCSLFQVDDIGKHIHAK